MASMCSPRCDKVAALRPHAVKTKGIVYNSTLPPFSSLHGVSLGDLALATTDGPFMTSLYEVRE